MSGIMVSGVYPQAAVLIALSGMTLLLDIPPFIWHIKNRNFAATTLVFWIMLLNLINMINASIWPNDSVVFGGWLGYGLCDVEAKLILGSWVALPGAVICIMRRLASVMDTNYTTLCLSKAQKARDIATQITFCWIGPVYLFAVHYIVQPNRYYLFSISGCNPSFDNSWPSIVLVFIWPLLFAILDTYYGVIVILRVYRYRSAFDTLLRNSNTTKSRFLRLWTMSTLLVVLFLPLQVYIFYKNVAFPRLQYSWDLVHGVDWNTVQVVPSLGEVVLDRWINVGCGFLVFIFFGTGQEAQIMYKAWLGTIKRRFICMPVSIEPCRIIGPFIAVQWRNQARKKPFLFLRSAFRIRAVAKTSNEGFTMTASTKTLEFSEKLSSSDENPRLTAREVGLEPHKQSQYSSENSMDICMVDGAAMDEFAVV